MAAFDNKSGNAVKEDKTAELNEELVHNAENNEIMVR